MDDDQKDAPGGFDPRYDPAFQRGYRPGPGERPRTRVRESAPTTPPPAAPRRRRTDEPAAAVPAREAAPPSAPRPAVPATGAPTLPPTPETAPAPPAEPVGGILSGLDLSPRRNPLMLALWLVACGFVVVGVVSYSVSVSLSYATTTQGVDIPVLVITQLGWMLAGPLITIGLATLVALLFLTALAGRPGPPPEPTDPNDDPDD